MNASASSYVLLNGGDKVAQDVVETFADPHATCQVDSPDCPEGEATYALHIG